MKAAIHAEVHRRSSHTHSHRQSHSCPHYHDIVPSSCSFMFILQVLAVNWNMNMNMIDAFVLTTVTQGLVPSTRSRPTRNSGNFNLHFPSRQCLLTKSGSSLMPLYSALPPAISIESLTCSHNGGETFQLKDVSYVLPRGSKQGLVGRNGCGKSTLLKILASACCGYQEEGIVYQGKVTSPRDVRVGFCEQEPLMPSDVTVADALLGVGTTNTETSDGARFNVVRTYRLAFNQANQDPDAFAAASAAMDSYIAWSVLTKAEEIASKLRVHHLQDKRHYRCYPEANANASHSPRHSSKNPTCCSSTN